MHDIWALILALKADTRAVTATEYALISSLIAIAVIGAVSLSGGALRGFFNAIGAGLTTAAALIGA